MFIVASFVASARLCGAIQRQSILMVLVLQSKMEAMHPFQSFVATGVLRYAHVLKNDVLRVIGSTVYSPLFLPRRATIASRRRFCFAIQHVAQGGARQIHGEDITMGFALRGTPLSLRESMMVTIVLLRTLIFNSWNRRWVPPLECCPSSFQLS